MANANPHLEMGTRKTYFLILNKSFSQYRIPFRGAKNDAPGRVAPPAGLRGQPGKDEAWKSSS
jgi:hypothetical protein